MKPCLVERGRESVTLSHPGLPLTSELGRRLGVSLRASWSQALEAMPGPPSRPRRCSEGRLRGGQADEGRPKCPSVPTEPLREQASEARPFEVGRLRPAPQGEASHRGAPSSSSALSKDTARHSCQVSSASPPPGGAGDSVDVAASPGPPDPPALSTHDGGDRKSTRLNSSH